MGTHMLIRAHPSRLGGLGKPAHFVWSEVMVLFLGTERISASGSSYGVLEGRNPSHALVLLKNRTRKRHQRVQSARRQENNCGHSNPRLAFMSHVTCPTEGLLNKARGCCSEDAATLNEELREI